MNKEILFLFKGTDLFFSIYCFHFYNGHKMQDSITDKEFRSLLCERMLYHGFVLKFDLIGSGNMLYDRIL